MTADLEIYQPGTVEPIRLVMTPEAAKALDDQLRAACRAVLREGTDYGVIPGTGEDRKTLLKPGAEKLLQWFGFHYTMECIGIERDDEGRKQGVTYRCGIVRRLPDGVVAVAACEGYAGYDEAKFFQDAEEAQHKAEARERMWAAKDGRVANPNKWKHITGYRAPWNTIIKMAQKRALVGATIDATAAAGLFTQDEDNTSPPADDGSTWYEQAIEAALTFTDQAAGSKLIPAAAQAHRDGLCTRGQQDHVQAAAKKRLRLLAQARPADAGDLAVRAVADQAHAAAEGSQDAVTVEDPPDWPEVTKPGTGTPKGQ